MAWVCDKCGFCCRYAGMVKKELNRGDGVCKHLTKDNLCGIYEDRPIYCRTSQGIDYTFFCNEIKRRALWTRQQ